MTTSTTTCNRIGRVLTTVRDRREQRLDRSQLRAQLVNYRSSAELSELSAIAERNEHVDTAELRDVLSRQLSA